MTSWFQTVLDPPWLVSKIKRVGPPVCHCCAAVEALGFGDGICGKDAEIIGSDLTWFSWFSWHSWLEKDEKGTLGLNFLRTQLDYYRSLCSENPGLILVLSKTR